MGLMFLDGSTVSSFVADEDVFNRSVDHLFSCLDADGDGVLSRSELVKGLENLMLLASSPSGAVEPEAPSSLSLMGNDGVQVVFDRFDKDQSGVVDGAEFRTEMREVMSAVARGLGESPVQLALDDQSFLKRAVEHGQSRSSCKKDPSQGNK